jgi:hypothetical protein
MKKLEFRPFSLYAPKDVIKKKFNEGYKEVAFSFEGKWTRKSSERIARMCAFFSEDGRIETYEHHEIDDVSAIYAIKPQEREFTEEYLKEYLKNKHIGLGKRRKITDVLQDIIGWDFR